MDFALNGVPYAQAYEVLGKFYGIVLSRLTELARVEGDETRRDDDLSFDW